MDRHQRSRLRINVETSVLPCHGGKCQPRRMERSVRLLANLLETLPHVFSGPVAASWTFRQQRQPGKAVIYYAFCQTPELS